MNHEGKEGPELGGENSFTSKCSEKSQPLDPIPRAKRLTLYKYHSYHYHKGWANYTNDSICSRNMIKNIYYDYLHEKNLRNYITLKSFYNDAKITEAKFDCNNFILISTNIKLNFYS